MIGAISVLSFPAKADGPIALSASNKAFLTLSRQRNGDANVEVYRGHITTYDRTRGFTHSGLQGRIENDQVLYLSPGKLERFGNLKAQYKRTVRDKNTTWVRENPCPTCAPELRGVTLKQDQKAVSMLRYYEKNKGRRSSTLSSYFAKHKALRAYCSLGFESLCPKDEEIGIVMERTDVGALSLVASALGTSTSVATFTSRGTQSALVTSSPEVALTIYRSTGPSLRDSVLDFREWRIVSAASAGLSQIHLINLELNDEFDFFDDIENNSRAINHINSRMTEFFGFVTDADLGCQYGLINTTPYFSCYIHSSDLRLSGPGAWLHTHAVMTPVVRNGRLFVSIHLYFTRKFDRKSRPPSGEFSDIDYRNRDQARMAQLATHRVANAFQNFFQPNIIVRR